MSLPDIYWGLENWMVYLLYYNKYSEEKSMARKYKWITFIVY